VNGTQPDDYVESVDDADLHSHIAAVKYVWLGACVNSLPDWIIREIGKKTFRKQQYRLQHTAVHRAYYNFNENALCKSTSSSLSISGSESVSPRASAAAAHSSPAGTARSLAADRGGRDRRHIGAGRSHDRATELSVRPRQIFHKDRLFFSRRVATFLVYMATKEYTNRT